ncbi:[NiFe]-hydrogenase assembly chaperone HybE [Bradyrhizobium sp.]|uniref:[NiFe]-hydrogenase assembly chaperone HybE n=1 Tax=Bradyrhizobium sp. TaxID=376 RepID=UPI003C74EAF1
MANLMPDLKLAPTLTDTEPHAIAVRLEAAFERVHRERMHDVPILNAALGIKAVGTREVEAGWLSALVTPWFINLMLLPRTPEQTRDCSALRLGSAVFHTFPAGRFEFIVGQEGDLGRYQMCSLFSPVLEFESHGAALITAESAIAVLFDARLAPDAPQEAGASSPDVADTVAVRRPEGGAMEAGKLSRRGLFFGRNSESEIVEP